VVAAKKRCTCRGGGEKDQEEEAAATRAPFFLLFLLSRSEGSERGEARSRKEEVRALMEMLWLSCFWSVVRL
jgi:hypothetical protein